MKNAVASLTWDNVAQRLRDGAAAILPIGAGAKQHGLHMPMGTDQVQAEYFATMLAEDINALIWPTVVYATYPAFVDYAGSVSLSNSTFEATLREIVEQLIRYGARQVLILNTGVSTQLPVDAALARLQAPALARHLNIHGGERYRRAVAEIAEQDHGSHADEIETSILLALAPELVDLPRARASPPLAGGPWPGPLTPHDPASPNYSPSGSFGDPTKATREKGRILLAAISQDLLGAARE